MERSKGPSRPPANDKRKVIGQTAARYNGASSDVGTSNRRMADPRMRSAERRHGGDGNEHRNQTHGRQFFIKGRVFSTSSDDGSNQSFLVIREAQDGSDDGGTHCTCFSVLPLRKDIDLSECGLLHSSSTQPPSVRGVKFEPLQVDVSRDARFGEPMLINYIKMFNVDINSEVDDIGKLSSESIQASMENFKRALFGSPMDRNGRDGRDEQEKRRGKGENDNPQEMSHGVRDQGRRQSQGSIAPTSRSTPAAPGSSPPGATSVPDTTNKKPKLRNLDVPQDMKRPNPKGPYDLDKLEDDTNSPTRGGGLENRRLQDARINQRNLVPQPLDQTRGNKDRREGGRRPEDGGIPKDTRKDGARGMDVRTGRPLINSQPNSPTDKRNLNHRRDGDDINKASNPGITVPLDDSAGRDKQWERNYPGETRDTIPLRKENGEGRYDPRGIDQRSTDARSRPQVDNDPANGRCGNQVSGKRSFPDPKNGFPQQTRRENPQNRTIERGNQSDENSDLEDPSRSSGRDAGKYDPRALPTERDLQNRGRNNFRQRRGGNGNPNSESRGAPGRQPDRRTNVPNGDTYPASSRPIGNDSAQHISGALQAQPGRGGENGANASSRSDPGRSNNRLSAGERRMLPAAGSSMPLGSSSGGGGGGNNSSRSHAQPTSRGRGPPGNSAPSRQDLSLLNNTGSESPGGGSSHFSAGSPVGGSPGGSFPMSRRSPPGGSLGGSSHISRGSPMGSHAESLSNSVASGSPVDSQLSPTRESSYQSPMGSSQPYSPSMTGRSERSRSFSPSPPRREFGSGSVSRQMGSRGGSVSNIGPSSGHGNGRVRRRGPKGKPNQSADDEQPPNKDADDEEPYIADDGCYSCGNGFSAWWKSVSNWLNGVGQEEWIQMEDQKNDTKDDQADGLENEDSRSVASGVGLDSPSMKDPFEDDHDDDDDDAETAVGDGEEGSDDKDGDDDDSNDESGFDQDDPDPDDNTRANSDMESDHGDENEEDADEPSTASSRMSSVEDSSTVVPSELGYQSSNRQQSEDSAENRPEDTYSGNTDSYSTNNHQMQTPQDYYSYAPNDDRSYMGQSYPVQSDFYPPYSNTIPPQELESAYPASLPAKSFPPPLPENAAELATDNNEPPSPPPYANIPSTPQQLSRPRSTRFELACERDPVELEVPDVPTTINTSTRGKSELFLPPSLTPGVATSSSGFSMFSARTPGGRFYPPVPQSSWNPPPVPQFTPYQPQTQVQAQVPAQAHANLAPQSQPRLRSGMNYTPQVSKASLPTYPRNQRYDRWGNTPSRQASPIPNHGLMTSTWPPVVPTRSELRLSSFAMPLNAVAGSQGGSSTARAQGPRAGERRVGKRQAYTGSAADFESGDNLESDSDPESDDDDDEEEEEEGDSEDEYLRNQRDRSNVNGDESGDDEEDDEEDDSDSDLDSGFGTYDEDLVGREDEGANSQNPPTQLQRNNHMLSPPTPAHVPIQPNANSNYMYPPHPPAVIPREQFHNAAMQPNMGMNHMQVPPDQPSELIIPDPPVYHSYQEGDTVENSRTQPSQPPQPPQQQHKHRKISGHNNEGRSDDRQRNVKGHVERDTEVRSQERKVKSQPKKEVLKERGKHGEQDERSSRVGERRDRNDDGKDSRGKVKMAKGKIDVRGRELERKHEAVARGRGKDVRSGAQEDVGVKGAGVVKRGEIESDGDSDSEPENEEMDSGSDVDSDLEPENEEMNSELELESEPGEEENEAESEDEGQSHTHPNEEMESGDEHESENENEIQSKSPMPDSLHESPVEEKKERRKRGEGDSGKRSGKERGEGGRKSERSGKEKGKERERGERRGKGGGERKGGRGRGRGRENEGMDLGGKLKKTWDFLKKLDYHE